MARVKDMLVTDSGLILGGSYVLARTWGGLFGYKTILDINTTLPDIAGGAALGIGKLLCTLPTEECVITGSAINMAITQTDGNITADTPEVGLGTTIASGANATLGDVAAACENILGPQVAADCNGTATVETVTTELALTTGGVNKTIYFNVADTWAASGDDAALLHGTVTLFWRRMNVV